MAPIVASTEVSRRPEDVFAVLIDATLQGPDAGTVVLGGLAVVTAVAAARH